MKLGFGERLRTKIAARAEQLVKQGQRKLASTRKPARLRPLISEETREERRRHRRALARILLKEYLLKLQENGVVVKHPHPRGKQKFVSWDSSSLDQGGFIEVWVEVRHGSFLMVWEVILIANFDDDKGLGVSITPRVGRGADKAINFRGVPSLIRYLEGPLTAKVVKAVSEIEAERQLRVADWRLRAPVRK